MDSRKEVWERGRWPRQIIYLLVAVLPAFHSSVEGLSRLVQRASVARQLASGMVMARRDSCPCLCRFDAVPDRWLMVNWALLIE